MILTDWVTPMIKQTSKPSRCIFVSVLLPPCENESLNAAPSGRRIIWGLLKKQWLIRTRRIRVEQPQLIDVEACLSTHWTQTQLSSVSTRLPGIWSRMFSHSKQWQTELTDTIMTKWWVKENKDKKITAGTHWSLFSCLNILWKSFLSLILIINKNVLPQFYFSLSMFFVIALLMSSWISSTSLWFLEIWDKVLIVEILCMTIIQYQATQIGLIFTISEILIHLQH